MSKESKEYFVINRKARIAKRKIIENMNSDTNPPFINKKMHELMLEMIRAVITR